MELDEILRHLRVDGFYVVEGVIPADRIDEVRDSVLEVQARKQAELEAGETRTRSRGHRVGVAGVTNVTQVLNETQTFAPYLTDERILGAAEAVFGQFVRISTTSGLVNNPGNKRGYWHADWPYNETNSTHVRPPYPDAMMHLSTIWMLTPFGTDNGGTFVVPGSHRAGCNPAAGNMTTVDQDAPYPTEMQVTGDAGSVMVYDSRLWHAVAPNRADQPRVALSVRYGPGGSI